MYKINHYLNKTYTCMWCTTKSTFTYSYYQTFPLIYIYLQVLSNLPTYLHLLTGTIKPSHLSTFTYRYYQTFPFIYIYLQVLSNLPIYLHLLTGTIKPSHLSAFTYRYYQTFTLSTFTYRYYQTFTFIYIYLQVLSNLPI